MKARWLTRGVRLYALLILGTLLLQPVKGVSDHGLDLVLVVVALASLRMPVVEAAAWGMAAGLLQDLCSVTWVGPHLLGNAAAAVFASYLKNRIYRERVLTQGLMVSGAILLKQLVFWALLAWDNSAPPFEDAWILAARTLLATSLVGFAAAFVTVRFGRRYSDPATA